MTSLLFLHGILGDPGYFDFLQSCVPPGCRMEKLLLEGHGGSARDFARASMSRWRQQVAEAVDRLRADGDRIVIVAHSMGTLFAIDSAVRGNTDGLFLLNPPLSLRLSRRMFTTPLKVLSGNIDDRWTQAAQAAYSIAPDSNPLHYIGWLPRYMELFGEIRRVRHLVGRLNLPARIYLSAHDEMISPLPAAALFPERDDISVTFLPDSGHYYYSDCDRKTIEHDFSVFVRKFM